MKIKVKYTTECTEEFGYSNSIMEISKLSDFINKDNFKIIGVESIEDNETIKTLEEDVTCARSFIRSKHLSREFTNWMEKWYFKR